jgi:hypothetical protein
MRIKLLFVLVLIALLALALTIGKSLSPVINKQILARLAIGMNEQEVSKSIGVPPGKYSNRVRTFEPNLVSFEDTDSATFNRIWVGDEGVVIVVFDIETRKVVSFSFVPTKGP